MNSNHAEHAAAHPLPGVQPTEPANVRKAHSAPSFVCIDTALTANGAGPTSDSGLGNS